MKSIMIILSLILFISFSACSTMDISHDYDTTYDYSQLKTYKWHHRKRAPKQVKHREVAKHIDGVIVDIMTDRGMTISDDEEVDFLINYQAAIDGKLKAQNYVVTVGYRGYGGWMYGGSGTTISSYDEGMLVIDILNGKTNELIYKGLAKVDMKDLAEDKYTKLNYIIEEMLYSFPPKN